MESFRVKGSTLRYKVDYIETCLGKESVEKLEQHFEGRALFPILDGSWYPVELYDELLRQTAEMCFGGDVRKLRALSASWAQESLSGVYKAFAWDQRLNAFLERLPRLHNRMFTRGRIVIQEDPLPDRHRLLLLDASLYTDAALYSAAGFYMGAVSFLGYTGTTCKFVRHGSRVTFTLDAPPPVDPMSL